MVSPAGIEPAISPLGGARYIHLTKRTMRHEYTR